MSIVDVDCTATDDGLCEFPEFDLHALVDDVGDPAAVTLFPADADEAVRPTTWLTVDVDTVVPLVDVR